MLISQVLNQENIDVRPYRVDHRWYCARYEGDQCRKVFYDVSYGLNMQSAPITKIRPKRMYYKYTYSMTSELKIQHVCYFHNFLLSQIY